MNTIAKTSNNIDQTTLYIRLFPQGCLSWNNVLNAAFIVSWL